MIFHENRLLADDSYVISYLIFFENWERYLKNLLSVAVVIGEIFKDTKIIKNTGNTK